MNEETEDGNSSPSKSMIKNEQLSQGVESNTKLCILNSMDSESKMKVDITKPSQSIVDELFKDFIAQKNAQVKTDTMVPNQTLESTSIEQMNALLDREISLISSQNSEVHRKRKHKKKKHSSNSGESKSSSRHKKKKYEHLSVDEDVTKCSSGAVQQPNSDIGLSECTTKISQDSNHENAASVSMNAKSGLSLLCEYAEATEEIMSSEKSNSTEKISNEKSANEIETFQSRIVSNECKDADKLSSVFDSTFVDNTKLHVGEDSKSSILPSTVIKPRVPLNKMGNISLKISNDSAQFIASGETVDKKGKRREEGEVVTSGSENNLDNCDEEDYDENGSKVSETGSLPESGDEKSNTKSVKKKKHKHKHKKKKKHKNKDREKDNAGKKNEKDSKMSQEKDDNESSKSSRQERNYRGRERSRSRSPSRSESKTEHSSNEVFDRGWDARCYIEDVRGYKYTSSRKDDRDRRKERHHSRSQSRSRSRSRTRSRRRSKSRSRSRDKKTDQDLRVRIDKKKLRKIAIANVLANMKAGNTDDIACLKSGGKSVEELTDFCKGLAGKDDFSSSDSDDSLADNDQEQPFIHHPFIVREAPPIIMNIRNSKQIPIMTQSEKTVCILRSQFPVSSGNQHRLKELEWVPVEKTTSSTTVSLEVVAVAKTTSAPSTSTTNVLATTTTPMPTIQPAAVVSDPVFPKPVSMPIDIGAIVSERLQAVRKLQENPYDVQALSKMHKSQERASQWAQSQYQPGQFTGSTGVQILTKAELEGTSKRHQAWLKKDQFKRAEPVKSGIGMFLLQKMGWKAGEGLGKNNEGSLEPLLLDLKVDRKGLQAQSEIKGNSRGFPKHMRGRGGGEDIRQDMPVSVQTSPKDLSGKHPVSGLLELCNRRKYGAPYFELVHESGPDHKKNFLFKVLVNQVEYQPSIASNNKKTAKAQAATVCLQELGMLPRQGPI